MDTIKKIAAFVILAIACIGIGFILAGAAGHGPLEPESAATWKTKLARWLVWEALHDEFESQPQPQHSYQTLPPEHPQNQPPRYAAGPDGEPIIDHGTGW